MSSSTENGAKKTTEDEAAIYDRQIRLWGADSQSKMASAKVLYVTISGVSSEILKNLVLAGIQSAVCDGRPYPDAVLHMPSSFLPPSERISQSQSDHTANTTNTTNTTNDNVDNDDNDDPSKSNKRQKKMTVAKAMQPHIHELNPLLEQCELNETTPIESIPDEYFTKFDIVVASQIGIKDAIRIAKATETSAKFFMVHSFGLESCAFIDLKETHTFRKEIGKNKLSDPRKLDTYTSFERMMNVPLNKVESRWFKNGPPPVLVKYRAILHYHDRTEEWPCESNADKFVTMTKEFLESQMLSNDYLGDDDMLKRLADVAMAEVSPVCAVMGGVIGNEVIKALSGKGEPANNTLMFDGVDGGCRNFLIRE